MYRDQWTLLLFRGEEGPIRQIRIPLRTVRVAAGAAVGAVVAVVGLVAAAGLDSATRIEARLLREENRTLTERLEEMGRRVGALESEVAEVATLDGRLRTLAGLPEQDGEVLAVGVGGPGSPALEQQPLYRLDPDLGQSAFAIDYDLSAVERRIGLLRASLDEAVDSLAAQEDLAAATPAILPTAGVLRSGFSRSRLHPILGRNLPHEGIDISAPRGTPILAAAKGTVRVAGWRPGYGLTVQIDHGYGYETLYGHADRVLVRTGQVVERGDVIGQVGSTGLSTSPHLHYEVRVAGRQVDPRNFILPGSIR